MRFSISLTVAIFAAFLAPVFGQDNPRKPGADSAPVSSSGSGKSSAPAAVDKSNKPALDKRQGQAGLTAAREAAAMAFVEQHHPELVELLRYLKEKQPAAYEQAAMDLFRASERLAQQKEVNYDRYELDLALWKVESRIELVAARLKMAGPDSPEGESLVGQLKKLLEERHDLRTERVVQERQRIAERAEKLDRQLQTLQANRPQAIERELNQFIHSPAARPPQKNTKGPR
jgi:hypothetical protein